MKHRSKLLVDPEVQYAIGGRIAIHWVLFVVGLVLLGVVIQIITTVGDLPFSKTIQYAVTSQIPVILVAMMLVPVFLRDTLRLTNRFAGPMFRLRGAIERLANGETNKPLNFRRQDFWQPVAESFNLVTAQVDALRQENAVLRREIDALRLEREAALASNNYHTQVLLQAN